jgi:hypothetical protein
MNRTLKEATVRRFHFQTHNALYALLGAPCLRMLPPRSAKSLRANTASGLGAASGVD